MRDVHAVHVVVGVGGVDESVGGRRLVLNSLRGELFVLENDPLLEALWRGQLSLGLVQRRGEQRVSEYLLQVRGRFSK